MYIDAVYCYRQSSVVCRSVTLVTATKTAEPIEMLFGLRTQVGQEPCIRWRLRSLHGKGIFEGGKGHPIVKYTDTLWSSRCKNG